jgi:hypothetical protein
VVEMPVYCQIGVILVLVVMEEDEGSQEVIVEKIEHLEHLSLVLLQRLSQMLRVSVPQHYGWKVVQRHEPLGEQLAVQLGLGHIEFVEQQMGFELLLKLLVV